MLATAPPPAPQQPSIASLQAQLAAALERASKAEHHADLADAAINKYYKVKQEEGAEARWAAAEQKLQQEQQARAAAEAAADALRQQLAAAEVARQAAASSALTAQPQRYLFIVTSAQL